MGLTPAAATEGRREGGGALPRGGASWGGWGQCGGVEPVRRASQRGGAGGRGRGWGRGEAEEVFYNLSYKSGGVSFYF